MAFESAGCGFYVVDDVFFVAFGTDGVWVDFGSVQAFGKDVAFSSVGVAVAELELFVGEFAVDVEDVSCACDFVGHLDCEDGFSEVGVCEEAAYFSFVPEFEIELDWVRSGGGVCDSLVGCLYGEYADFDGLLLREGIADFGGELLYYCFVHLCGLFC